MTDRTPAIGLCACMGPVGADPHCPCKMRSMGLEPTNLWTPKKVEELKLFFAAYAPNKENPQ